MANLIKFVVLLAIVLPACLAFTIKLRNSWGAAPARSAAFRINGAVPYVVIHHSDNPSGCSSESSCERLIKEIQTEHTEKRKFSDIGYNFIVAGDGNVYEGRGWGVQGSHAPTYNQKSIGILFLGNSGNTKLLQHMLKNAKDLLNQAVSDGHLKDDYMLIGNHHHHHHHRHHHTKPTTWPGSELFNEIESWPHFYNFFDF